MHLRIRWFAAGRCGRGEYYWPILGMLAFGSTFAAPFFALAMMPGTLKALPKSGGWLNAVKVVMGFVELGVAVKYISVVDQQWNSVPRCLISPT